LWWLLITADGPPRAETLSTTSDRACPGQEIGPFDLGRLAVEDVDEQLADDLALGLGVGDAGQFAQEQLAGVHVDQRNVVVVAEQGDDLLGLLEAQQAGVDEHAGQLVADRLVYKHGGHRAVDAARQAADHLAGSDLVADLLDHLLPERGHGPVALQTGELQEVAIDFRAIDRVNHFGWNCTP